MMKRHLFAAVLAVIASVWTTPIAAQVTTGTIVGTVTDANASFQAPTSPSTTIMYIGHPRDRCHRTYTAPFLTPAPPD